MSEERANNTLSRVLKEGTVCASIVLVLFLLLWPVPHQGATSQRRLTEYNNMMQIGLAMMNHYSEHASYPENIIDEHGNPILSWRVRLLPYLGQQDLFEKFDITQPWDSEQNNKLIMQMPEIFQIPTMNGAWGESNGQTSYLRPLGDDKVEAMRTMFSIDRICKNEEVKDGLDRTVILVQVDADNSMPWTKPDDHSINFMNPKRGLAEYRNEYYLLMGADTSVQELSNKVSEESLAELFTIDGGEPVPDGW